MSTSQKKKQSFLPAVLGVVLITGLLGFYLDVHASHTKAEDLTSIKIDGFVLPTPKAMTPFKLTDSNKKAYTQQNLVGHWTLMFFGFTSCQYVCPTTLSDLNKFYSDIKSTMPAQNLPEVVFVTVDPARDTLQKLHDYVRSFNPNFLGARAQEPQLQSLAKQLNVTYKKVPMGDDYSMQHSAEVMLLDPKGELLAYFSYPHEASEMIHDYEEVIDAYTHSK